MTTLEIRETVDVPDSTYFTQTRVSPELRTDPTTGGTYLAVANDKGTRRSTWGTPYAYTDLEYYDGFVVASLRWGNKHAWGSQDYYFVDDGDRWVQKTKRSKIVKVMLAAIAAAKQSGNKLGTLDLLVAVGGAA